jgi:hypothetical protein
MLLELEPGTSPFCPLDVKHVLHGDCVAARLLTRRQEALEEKRLAEEARLLKERQTLEWWGGMYKPKSDDPKRLKGAWFGDSTLEP